jgi:hypothetical protein
MNRGLLIAGNESTLASAIAAEAGRRLGVYCAALIPNRLAGPPGIRSLSGDGASTALPDGLEQGPMLLDWNPGSPVSARALVLAAENKLGRLDEALLVCAPPAVRKNPEDLNSSNIDIIVNDYIKGWFFLVKELTAIFAARSAGTLALALSEAPGGGREDADLIGPSVSASFRSFAQALMASSRDSPYDVLGFILPAPDFPGGSEGGDNAGAFVFKTLEDRKKNRGKWHKLGSKLPFFGR